MSDTRLKHTVAVARLGSFTKAAAALGLTQSAVTKSVAEIERQLGYPVFYRTSRGAQVTEEGRNFVDNASRILTDVDELFARSRAGGDRYAGVLRIGICPASAEWLLIEPCVQLLKKHGSVRLEVIGSASERITEMLRQGRLDIAVGPMATFQEWKEFKTEQIAAIYPRLFVKKGHELATLSKITLADLARQEFIVPLPMQPYLAAVIAVYEAAGLDWTQKVHLIDYFPAVERMVQEFGLVGFVASSYARTNRFSSRFTMLAAPEMFSPMPFCCAYRRRWAPKPASLAFTRAVRKLLPPA